MSYQAVVTNINNSMLNICSRVPVSVWIRNLIGITLLVPVYAETKYIRF